MDIDTTPYVRPNGAAKLLGVTPSTLAKWRLAGIGPRYCKSGPRFVLYSRADIAAYLASRLRSSTSEVPAAGNAA